MLISLSKPKKAIHLSDIPPELKGLRILNPNAGATSIVLEKNASTVYVLTRDEKKKEWIVSGLRLDSKVEEFNIVNKRMRSFGEEPIYCIEMPKLFPLSAENKKRALKDIKEFERIYDTVYSKNLFKSRARQIQKMDVVPYSTEETLRLLEGQNQNNIIIPYLIWATSHDNYLNDIGIRNFMQDSSGKIILLDPIVSEEVHTYLYPHHSKW